MEPNAETVDAVVIGAGANGLVAAAGLADAGWDVLVLEAQDEIGGAVKSAELWPGVTADLYSAFYPLAAASPVIRSLELERYGLEWAHAPAVVAHCADPGSERCAVLHRDPARTAEALDEDAPGDGQVWLDLLEQWRRLRDPLLRALFTAFPPVRPGVALLRQAGIADALRLARMAVTPATRLGQELFRGEFARQLLGGNAMHADVPMDAAGSGLYGWLLVMLGQDVGFPAPRGGAGNLAQAMARRAQAAGAQIDTGERVTSVVVRDGRALGVRTAGGRSIRARRAVLADVDAPTLYRQLVGVEHLPPRMVDDLDRFQWDLPTVKVNWTVEGGIPWRATEARQAGTVHVGTDVRGLARWSSDLALGVPTDEVFALVGQMTTTDPTRSPAGTESVWAYTHLQRDATDADAERVLGQLDDTMEAFAPGFLDRVRGRVAQLPSNLETTDANLVNGAINGGTAQLFQQLVFRPVVSLGRPETVVDGLLVAGASTHPGGGVHGACGWIAAQAALRASGPMGPLRRAARGALNRQVYAAPRAATPLSPRVSPPPERLPTG